MNKILVFVSIFMVVCISILIYLYIPNKKIVYTKDFTIAYYDSEEKHLYPVIFVHGFLVDGRVNWFTIISKLRGKYRIIVPDLLFANIKNISKNTYCIDKEALLIQQLLEKLGIEQFTIVFFSLGCLLSPEFIDRAEKSILIAAPPMDSPTYRENIENIFHWSYQTFAKSLFVSNPWWFTPLSRKYYYDTQQYFKILKLHILKKQNYAKNIVSSEKVLLIHAAEDRFFPGAHHKNLKNVHTIKNAGHAVMWDAPDALAAEIQYFLENSADAHP